MNISLSEQLKDYVDQQVSSGRYSSASEYIRELVRNDERRRAQEELESMLLVGMQSSGPSPFTKEDWAQIRRDAVKQLESRKKRSA